MNKGGVNLTWQAKVQALMGTQLTIPLSGIIDAVHLSDGRHISSPYEDNNPYKPIVNSEEAKQYLGKTGTITRVLFQRRDIQMENGAVVILLVSEDR